MPIISVLCKFLKCPPPKSVGPLVKESVEAGGPQLKSTIKSCADTFVKGSEGKTVFDSEDIFVSSLGKLVPQKEVIGLDDVSGLKKLDMPQKNDFIDL